MQNTGLVVSVLAGMFVFSGANGALDYIAPPSIDAKIVVHSLQYEVKGHAPVIKQHRTVEAENAIFAGWSAQVRQGDVVICQGNGVWEYASGEITAEIDFDQWVGDSGCHERLENGVTYQVSAEYKWGDGNVATQTSTGFLKG